MNIVLLSGGSGKRLWPLSNDVRSKQFIKIFKTDDGKYESMIQRVYNQIKRNDPDAKITIATSKSQISAIHNQLGHDVGISVEPCRRDTFPAIVLASAYLHDIQGVGMDEVVVICPVDPYVNDDYFKALGKISKQAEKGEANLVLMGIEPDHPSEKYGYIIPKSADNISMVSTFKEKPTQDIAKDYIAKGALWNGGVFAYKLGYVLNKAHELLDFNDYNDLFSKYETLAKISFDYAVVEKEDSIQVQRFAGTWKDIGTWNSLSEIMEENIIGDATTDDSCENLHIINEMELPVLCMGLNNMVVSVSSDGILVSSLENADKIKPYVDKINNQIKFAEKSWGSYRVLDIEDGSMTIKICIRAGHRMNYHSHARRNEIWNIVSGNGKVIIDGKKKLVSTGDVISIEAGVKHTIIADTQIKIIEIQIGEDISVSDKTKFELDI